MPKENKEIKSSYFEGVFKNLFTDKEHLEPLTLLISRVLRMDYQNIEGKFEIISNDEKEREIVILVHMDIPYKLILNLNLTEESYQKSIKKSNDLIEEEFFNKNPGKEKFAIYAVNFNAFFTNEERRDVIDEYMFRNKYNDILRTKVIFK